ncbi:unnamed protein product [Didymodactylos carnosus]|uniref:Uncharacterized protein n=1 Tax=Didymodactylos carnosus TaxID=1234261 RepID=A0A815W5P6_9BILA|nr:unnamed protein product [Didymodactylos carnosus]CAF4404205.1 unnamed protein product [Didymodactylos carnosus]
MKKAEAVRRAYRQLEAELERQKHIQNQQKVVEEIKTLQQAFEDKRQSEVQRKQEEEKKQQRRRQQEEEALEEQRQRSRELEEIARLVMQRQQTHLGIAGVFLFIGAFVFFSFGRDTSSFTWHYIHMSAAVLISISIYLFIATGAVPGVHAVHRIFANIFTHLGAGLKEYGVAVVRTTVNMRAEVQSGAFTDNGKMLSRAISGNRVLVEAGAVPVRLKAHTRAQVGPKCIVS